MGDVVRLVVGLVVGLAVLGGYAVWLHRRLAVAPDWARRTRRAVLVVEVVAGVVFVVGASLLRRGDPVPTRVVVWPAMTLLAVVLYLTIGLVLLALVSLGLRLAGRPEARRRLLRAGTPAVVVLALLVTAGGVVAATRPAVRTTEVTVADLPASYDGLRVALVTDLHVGPLHDDSWTRRVVAMVEAEDPDLVVLGGDLVDGSPEHVARYLEPLRDLDPRLGVVGVIGNHELLGGLDEAREWVETYRGLGVEVLVNESRELAPGLVVTGVSDATGTDDLAPDEAAALAGVDPEGFVLHLAHEPHQVEDLPRGSGVDLALSGHTHGGQLWPMHLLTPLSDPVTQGYAEVAGVPTLVSRGVGTSGPPVRVLAPAQVDLVVLRSAG